MTYSFVIVLHNDHDPLESGHFSFRLKSIFASEKIASIVSRFLSFLRSHFLPSIYFHRVLTFNRCLWQLYCRIILCELDYEHDF
ncbi:hypothetical protein DNO_0594 [Dichelobacter nodosus VCS1703A]|uniref:Uncharacterized protein n=1 Tax=Dichelobacter nodosus (strain VCS1703A) TaxID=246195 RepID=A5EVF3_DICNV|nr:hypothetical protein DNO_0594 [Dichelobacter nodosus VCS1703A]